MSVYSHSSTRCVSVCLCVCVSTTTTVAWRIGVNGYSRMNIHLLLLIGLIISHKIDLKTIPLTQYRFICLFFDFDFRFFCVPFICTADISWPIAIKATHAKIIRYKELKSVRVRVQATETKVNTSSTDPIERCRAKQIAQHQGALVSF